MEFLHIITVQKLEVLILNKKNFCVGMGMGLMFGLGAGMMMRPKKRCMKSVLGRTLKTLSEVADSISDNMGW